MGEHSVMPFVNGIGARLASRSRHVVAFVGAGAGRACGLPDVTSLQQLVLEELAEDDRVEFNKQLAGRNLEAALSRLRRIAALLGDSADKVDGLTGADAATLDREVCRLIIAALDIGSADLAPMLRFAAWAARADYHQPLELFTVNYDLLLESALEALAIPYFDGFVGTLRARFRTDLVEAEFGDLSERLPSWLVRLWKLHGSVNWIWDGAEVVRIGLSAPDGQPAAIYPSDAKYDESRRMPFVVLQDRLRRSLQLPETLVFVSGYSFGDAHLNEMLFEAARRHPRSELIAFCFRDIPDALAEQALVTPNLQAVGASEAVLGGRRAAWEDPGDAPPDLWADGQFRLGDFGHLAAFLARSSPPQQQIENRLAEAVGGAGGDDA